MTDPAAQRPHPFRQEHATASVLDDWLDQALADTFPASDPVASPPAAALDAEVPGAGTGPEPVPRRRHRRPDVR